MHPTRILITTLISFIIVIIFGIHAQPALAGNVVLNNNVGDTSSTWFIEGEPTLIMNGFDLTPLNLNFPVSMDAVSIAVQEAVPNEGVQVVIYADDNGGSPIDSTLIFQEEVSIGTTGTVRIALSQPVTINAPVVWVGFRLPVGFRFFADESGSSVLTYWGWTPGTTFDLSNLSSAQVFGPSDGSEPVGIDLGGVARIAAELITDGAGGTTSAPNLNTGDGQTAGGVPVGRQIQGGQADLGIMSQHPFCGERILFDPQDIRISAGDRFTIHCRADLGAFSPGVIRNNDELPAEVPSFERRGFLYEVFAAGDYQADPRDSEKLFVPVTHCLRPEQAELDMAVVGIAYGAPRTWEILPTVRFNEWVCAEVTHQGFVSYFVPRTGEEPTLNADLQFSGFPFLTPLEASSDRGLLCGFDYIVTYSVFNEGFVETPQTVVRVEMRSDRTGTVSRSVDYVLPPVPPGATVDFEQRSFTAPTTFFNETHTLRLIIDPNNGLTELNEDNNVFVMPDILVLQTNRCR